jgi:hypothetical protein
MYQTVEIWNKIFTRLIRIFSSFLVFFLIFYEFQNFQKVNSVGRFNGHGRTHGISTKSARLL